MTGTFKFKRAIKLQRKKDCTNQVVFSALFCVQWLSSKDNKITQMCYSFSQRVCCKKNMNSVVIKCAQNLLLYTILFDTIGSKCIQLDNNINILSQSFLTKYICRRMTDFFIYNIFQIHIRFINVVLFQNISVVVQIMK